MKADTRNATVADRQVLLKQLDGLYRFAQIVTQDTTRAARLVEATYRYVMSLPADSRPPFDDRAALLRVMKQIHEGDLDPASGSEETPLLVTEKSGAGDLNRKLAMQYVERAIPTVLATLYDSDRVVLLLRLVDNLPNEQVARVLGSTEDEAAEALHRARLEVTEELMGGATSAERQLLETSLPEEWLELVLRRVAESEYAALPPTLRLSVSAATQEAGERVRPKETASGAKRSRAAVLLWVGGALMALFIVAAGVFAYYQMKKRPVETDLITLVAGRSDDIEPEFRTDSPEQAEYFLRDRFDWRITVPGIEGAALTGVGIAELPGGAQVPVCIYEDSLANEVVALFAFNYAFLDRNRAALKLAPDVLHQIEDERHFDLHDLGEEKVLVWRNRDDIFIAVTSGDADALKGRISFPY